MGNHYQISEVGLDEDGIFVQKLSVNGQVVIEGNYKKCQKYAYKNMQGSDTYQEDGLRLLTRVEFVNDYIDDIAFANNEI